MSSSPFRLHQNREEKLTQKLMAVNTIDKLKNVTNLSWRYENLLCSEKFTDCAFNVDGEIVQAHKLILSTASAVFEAMFYGPCSTLEKYIDILDISADTFRKFVIYIYRGYLDFELLSIQEIFELYYCGEKYLIKELITDCLQAITHKLSFANILQALELSLEMNFDNVAEICLIFFFTYCLCDAIFLTYHRQNYHHISKECIKTIIAANKGNPNHLMWFVIEWCQHECRDYGMKKEDCMAIIDELKLNDKYLSSSNISVDNCDMLALKTMLDQQQPMKAIERTYYKACRPFQIGFDANEWKFLLRTERYISLHGIILHGRLAPSNVVAPRNSLQNFNSFDYNENFTIQISASTKTSLSVNDTIHRENALQPHESVSGEPMKIFEYKVNNQKVKYNLDANIVWEQSVTLTPNILYEIKLTWNTDCFGAEYPCCIQSNSINGIYFYDVYNFVGSLIKGIRFKEFVISDTSTKLTS